ALVDRMQGAVERQRHARERRVVSGSYGERLDVETTPREEPGDPCQHARLVLNEQRDDVLAAGVDPAGGLEVGEVEYLFGSGLAHALAHHVPRRLAGRDHWVAVLFLGDLDVEHDRALRGD